MVPWNGSGRDLVPQVDTPYKEKREFKLLPDESD